MIEDMHWGYHLQGDIGLWFTPGGLNKGLEMLHLSGIHTHIYIITRLYIVTFYTYFASFPGG